MTQSNTANAEESASAAQELSSQVVQLKQMLSKFKIKNQTGSSTSKIKVVDEVQEPVGANNSGQPIIDGSDAFIALDEDEFGKF